MERVVIPIPEEEQTCPVCGTQMALIGEEYVRRELEFVPATCKVIEYYSQSYGCPSCKEGLGDTEKSVIIKSPGSDGPGWERPRLGPRPGTVARQRNSRKATAGIWKPTVIRGTTACQGSNAVPAGPISADILSMPFREESSIITVSLQYRGGPVLQPFVCHRGKSTPVIIKSGGSYASRRKSPFWRLSRCGLSSIIPSGIPGWTKLSTMLSIGVIQRRLIGKTDGAALPIILARMRAFAVGRKSWLFSSSVEGANASAVVYTMVEMAKAHNLNIYEYLKFLLERRPNQNMIDKQLAELAPWSEKLQSIKNGR